MAAKVMMRCVECEMGGEGVVVELDESKFTKRKYNKGRITSSTDWIFGGIVRGDWSKYFVVVVKDRKTETLGAIIADKILPGTTIHTDEWPAYFKICKMLTGFDYIHKTVCHKKSYVNQETRAHTQNIEGFWSFVKREIKKHGTRVGDSADIVTKIHSVCFKKKHKDDAFEAMISELLKL